METAYELKALGEIIAAEAKVKGLTLGEEALEVLGASAYLGFKKWMKESAVVSTTKVDDFISPFYDQADAFVLPLIEKIDLDKDGK